MLQCMSLLVEFDPLRSFLEGDAAIKELKAVIEAYPKAAARCAQLPPCLRRHLAVPGRTRWC